MPQNLKALTSLRFFAAGWVVLFRYWPSLGVASPLVIAKGYLGVELFFVLSGFILCHVYLEKFGERRFSYREFLWVRLARIYPVHLATLAGLGLLIAAATLAGLKAGDKLVVWSSLPAQITLTQAWGLAPLGGWNHPSWSISAEWFAYLAFPIFAWTAWRLRSRPGLAVVLALGLIAWLYPLFERLAGFPLTEATTAWGALRIVPCFALGCAVYLLWRARPLAKGPSAAIAAVACLLAILAAARFSAPEALYVALFGGLIYSLAGLASAGSSLLTAPVFVYLGEVSYSIYMVCVPWQLAFENAAHKLFGLSGQGLPLALWLVLIVGIIPAAMAVHHLIERPARVAMRRHRWWLGRRGASTGAPTPQLVSSPAPR
ncbi:MAG TPA: acyltransferase [Caulobacteraceae bacterium]